MVDVPLDALSLTDLAARKGVSKQAIHKRVKAFIAEGLLASFPGPKGSVMVSEAAYDMAVGQTGDPVKEQSAATAAVIRGNDRRAQPAEGQDSVGLRDAKARGEHYTAELRRLQFERQNGKLYTVEEVQAAMGRIAEAIRSGAKGLVAKADDGADALDKGMPYFRRWLSAQGDDLCRSVASELRIVAVSEPVVVTDAAEEPENED